MFCIYFCVLILNYILFIAVVLAYVINCPKTCDFLAKYLSATIKVLAGGVLLKCLVVMGGRDNCTPKGYHPMAWITLAILFFTATGKIFLLCIVLCNTGALVPIQFH